MKETDLIKGFSFTAPGPGKIGYEIISRKGDGITLQRGDGTLFFTNIKAMLDTLKYMEVTNFKKGKENGKQPKV